LLVVAGLNLKSLEPRVWDKHSPYYLPDLQAVMVSYAEFHQLPWMRRRAMERGLHKALGIPKRIKIFLDNGAFYFSRNQSATPIKKYEEFVTYAQPDWRPIPRDFIPSPSMTLRQQRSCLTRTMRVNLDFQHDGYVPVIHISRVLQEYVSHMKANKRLAAKPSLALGGIVPNLLRAPKSLTHCEILESLISIRHEFADKSIHVFGIGGVSTLHVAALLKIDSVDSSGWRNRAAHGIIQLPGSGERVITQLGSWEGRKLNRGERIRLLSCECPACQDEGISGLKAKASRGFRNRATHNLWTLLKEAGWIKNHLKHNSYQEAYKDHLDNTIYRPLINLLVNSLPMK
jgi:7-cyano-7-deazaguanine tRNA-ribosyltransferase